VNPSHFILLLGALFCMPLTSLSLVVQLWQWRRSVYWMTIPTFPETNLFFSSCCCNVEKREEDGQKKGTQQN
jgi:hypothetical protein